ncbi:MAG: hypothetical protein AB7I04_11400 [Pseudomonadales bacterium]
MFSLLTRMAARQRPEQAPVSGSRLARVGQGAWVADRELVYGRGTRLPVRMVVVAHAPRSLTLYSPVALDPGTLEALSGLGTVTRIVAPNRFHTLFVPRALDAFPEAVLLVPPTSAGLEERFAHRAQRIVETVRLGEGTELKPVVLRAGLEELVLYHDPAELLVLCDLLFNLHGGSRVQQLGYRLNGIWGRPALSRLQRLLLLKDRQSLGSFYRWAMAKPFGQISMAHGQMITTGAREVFYQLFGARAHG